MKELQRYDPFVTFICYQDDVSLSEVLQISKNLFKNKTFFAKLTIIFNRIYGRTLDIIGTSRIQKSKGPHVFKFKELENPMCTCS